MRTSYRLEIWVDPSCYHDVCKVMKIPTDKEPRSILTMMAEERHAPPEVQEINHFLDVLEGVYPSLEAVGVSRDNISMWLECTSEQECLIEFDPMTLYRLGIEGVKACINSWDYDTLGVVMNRPERIKLKQVDIEEVWIEVEASCLDAMLDEDLPLASGKTEVMVRFDDMTLWRACFMSYEHLHLSLARDTKQIVVPGGAFFWENHMILVDTLSRQRIESVIMEMLGRQVFELAFEQIEGKDSVDDSGADNRIDLSILYDGDDPRLISDVLNLSEEAAIFSSHLWTLSRNCKDILSCKDEMHGIIDLLEGKYDDLKKLGIQRRDIKLVWNHRHMGQGNLELDPDVMVRMGRNGLSWDIQCMAAPTAIARTVE